MPRPTLFLLLAAAPLVRAQGPNIVVLYADDHAQAAVGAYGSVLCKTPAIDRLAAEGMRFTRSFVANSICGPARATLLTGLHSTANGKTTNEAGFRDELPTFATGLQARGYRTAMVGKWHLPTDPRGFDHWAIARGGYYNPSLVGPEGTREVEGYTTDVITDEALAWLDGLEQGEGEEAPFLLWINHAATHRTWMPGPRYLDRYRGGVLPEPRTLFDDHQGRAAGAAAAQMSIADDLFPAYDLKLPVSGEGILDGAARGLLERMTEEQRTLWEAAYGPENEAFLAAGLEGEDLVRWKYQRYIADYLRCVAALDDAVARVLAWLDEHGHAEDTVVIYSSDQGFFLGEHGWYDKRWMYEPSLSTPLIVRWPGVVAPGSVCDALVQNIDMAPTLLAIGGAERVESMHGSSLVPWLRGKTPASWREMIYYHYQELESGRTGHIVARHDGVRGQRYKLIDFYDLGEFEFYDLERDPQEMVNLAGDPEHALRIELFQRGLASLRERFADGPGR